VSALLHIGEADHKLLNADAEIVAVAMHGEGASLARAREQLAEARAALAAVRLVLRSHALAELLAYHETMEARLRAGALLMRTVLNNPLAANADTHAARAKLLRTLIGAPKGK